MKKINFLLCLLFMSKSIFAQIGEIVFPITEQIKVDELDGRYLKVFTNHKYESENIISCKWYDVAKGVMVSDYKPALDYLGVLLFRFNDTKLLSIESIKINPDKKYIPLEVYETYQVGNTINLLAKLYNKDAKEVYLDCFSYDIITKVTTNKRLVAIKKGTDMVVYKDKGNKNFVCLTGSKSFFDFSDNFNRFNYWAFNQNLELINQGENISMTNPARQEAVVLNNGDLLFCNMINNSLSSKRAYKLQFFKITKNEAKEISFAGEPFMSNAKFIVDKSNLKITCLAKKSPLNIFNSILIGDVDLNANKITNIKVSNFKELGSVNNADDSENDKKADENFEKIKDNEPCNLPRMTCIMDIIYGPQDPTIFIDRVHQYEKKADYTTYKFIEMGYGALVNSSNDISVTNYSVLKYGASFSDLSVTKSPCNPQPLQSGKFIVAKNEKSTLIELNKKNYHLGGFAFSTIVPNYYFVDGNKVFEFRYDWTKETISLSKKEVQ